MTITPIKEIAGAPLNEEQTTYLTGFFAGMQQRAVVVLTSSREAHEFGERLERTSARGFVHKGELSGEALALLAGGTS